MTSITVDPESENFEKVKASVLNDFERVKAEKPDIIMVLPHMGEQFLDEPDEYQKTWNEIFISAGADIVFNDHTHSVQPVEVFERNGKNHIIVNCPGNFANIYREHFGDASAMVEVYIDKTEKSLIGAAVIPMWTESQISGNYRAVPVYDILNNDDLRSKITTYDLERIEEVHKHITSVMLGKTLSTDLSRERYYITNKGFFLPGAKQLEITDKIKSSVLYKKIVSSESVCYVGDSITEGTKNGGYGWYKPIEKLNTSVSQCAVGGGTTKTILPDVSSNSKLYIVALGTNDVRYRNENICAMTSEEYINELQKFVKRIRNENPEAEFAFIAPWFALENDTVCVISPEERDLLFEEYTVALEKWCLSNGFIFSNPNSQIKLFLDKNIQSEYMVDYIHPNSTKGIQLYSKCVFESIPSIC